MNEITLGSTVKDSITGFTGIAVGEYKYLNGCVRINIQPTKLKDGKSIESETFDIEQLELVDKPKKKEVEPSGGPHPEPTPRPEG